MSPFFLIQSLTSEASRKNQRRKIPTNLILIEATLLTYFIQYCNLHKHIYINLAYALNISLTKTHGDKQLIEKNSILLIEMSFKTTQKDMCS